MTITQKEMTRRTVLQAGAATTLLAAMPAALAAQTLAQQEGDTIMSTIETRDGTKIFYKDWGPRDAQPIVFHHGWPLSSDDWDNQMLYFLANGYRVIAHDRRGHGRSDQTDQGHDMVTYANDVVDLAAALDLKDAVHIGHSTGGGEVAAYVARSEPGRVAKAALLGAIPPLMLQTADNPDGVPKEAFDGLRAGLAANPGAVLPRCAVGTVLWLQSRRCRGQPGADQQLVAPGHDGQCVCALSVYRCILRDRPDRGPQGDECANPCDARR